MRPLVHVSPIESSPEYSLARVELEGINRPCRNNLSDTFYKCIGGSVIFIIGGVRHPVATGETVFVRKGVPYQDMSIKGAVLEACCVPPFDPDQVDFLD